MSHEDHTHRPTSPGEPTAHDARAALIDVDRVAAVMRKDVSALRAAMLGWAGANVVGLLLVGLVPSLAAVLSGTALILAASGPVALVGSRARARDLDANRRYLHTIAAWTALFVPTVLIGVTFFHEVPAFWVPASLLCAAPLVLFVWSSRRRAR